LAHKLVNAKLIVLSDVRGGIGAETRIVVHELVNVKLITFSDVGGAFVTETRIGPSMLVLRLASR
jgi:hypothetical protein